MLRSGPDMSYLLVSLNVNLEILKIDDLKLCWPRLPCLSKLLNCCSHP